MQRQYDLFDVNPIDRIPEPHPGETDTSREAAEKIAPVAGTLRHAVYMAIDQARARGLTTSEIVTILVKDNPKRKYSSVQPRTTELHKAKLIFDSGKCRKNPSENKETVWVA